MFIIYNYGVAANIIEIFLLIRLFESNLNINVIGVLIKFVLSDVNGWIMQNLSKLEKWNYLCEIFKQRLLFKNIEKSYFYQMFTSSHNVFDHIKNKILRDLYQKFLIKI